MVTATINQTDGGDKWRPKDGELDCSPATSQSSLFVMSGSSAQRQMDDEVRVLTIAGPIAFAGEANRS